MNNHLQYLCNTIEQLRKTMMILPQEIIIEACDRNQWFTPENIHSSLQAITNDLLDKEHIRQWLHRYPALRQENRPAKDVAIVMAGNIPMVGFFDLLCVVICGDNAFVKYSSKDRVLMQWVTERIRDVFGSQAVTEMDDRKTFDAVIATGSNNAIRHLSSHYNKAQLLVRGSKTSAAIITPYTSEAELLLLWEDIFTYFCMGCRNVTHLFLPQGTPLHRITEIWTNNNKQIVHTPYLNAYRQIRAVKQMNKEAFTDVGYCILCEGSPGEGPICQITYSYYTSQEEVEEIMKLKAQNLQCVVSDGSIDKSVAFGSAQHPLPWEYADGKDLMLFLLFYNFDLYLPEI